ncbi:universal stress protein [Haloplanus rubicundus]|uniref:Universal stress protein n=1 Tax=Haloplanus rubicundus TaxID=1547898 RepID=A0A345EFX0_9EURY|nr:universal stress protein [Haloplanus rubicundus]AXG07674.1 universal stress protein [Haloplanus rubicundus]AXG11092.1 universal stress protein [Haloplanus rubicundus]
MLTRVLVPLDDSPLATRALEHALDEWSDAEVVVLHVVDPLDAIYESEVGGPIEAERWYESEMEATEDLFDRARARAAETDVSLRTATAVGNPGREIVRYVAANDVDHVVLGSHGRRGLERLVLGSVAERVLRRAEATVTVVR